METVRMMCRSVLLFCVAFVFLSAVSTPLYARDAVDELIVQGSGCNNHFLYADAVKYLSEAIKRGPSAKEAYKERAFSYFELNELDLALEDYYHALDPSPPYKIRHTNCFIYGVSWIDKKPPSLDFARGLLQGARILQESARCASKNTLILKKTLNGSVIPHNPNVVPHVMQKKHRWDKYVRLSGNEIEDFKKVTAFLEEIEILKCEKSYIFPLIMCRSIFIKKTWARTRLLQCLM